MNEQINRRRKIQMGKISFIHLSDIHFCKTSGKNFDIDNDLRNAVLTDIFHNAKEQLEDIKGILIGGDIAFTGRKEEYDKAKEFLKELTARLEVDEKNIFCVPGNHDINQAIVKESRSECICCNDDRLLKVKVYPRVLSDDRDRFIADDENCIQDKNYFEYSLNVDDKRKGIFMTQKRA